MGAKPDLNQSVQSIAEVLATSTQESLHVPDYQRSYSWRTRQFKDMWEDLYNFTFKNEPKSNTYFLGAVVFVSGDNQEILDGQQRLTTVTILLVALANFLRSVGEAEYADAVMSDFIARRERGGPKTRFKLILNSIDAVYFRELIQEQKQDIEPDTQSHKNIRACKRYFDSQIRGFKREFGADAGHRARQLADTLLDKVFLCSITAYNLSAAGAVFERLNDRGVGLTPVDLVRSLVMQRSSEREREEILDGWRRIFRVEGRGNVDDLLRFHWVTREGDATANGLYKLIKERFNLGDDGYSPVQFTHRLRRAADVYNAIYTARSGQDRFTDIASFVVDLNAKPLIPLLMKLHGFKNRTSTRLAEVAFAAFIRNRVIANLSSTTFEDVAYRVARDVEENDDSVDAGVKSFNDYMLDDEDFARAFASRSIATQAHAKLVLRMIESHLQREGASGDQELVVGNNSDVELEHVYPRKPLSGQEWEDHPDWVNRLGNLSLLAAGLNRVAQNDPFEEKLEEYQKSKLILTKKLTEQTEWTTEQIEDRQRWMANLAVKVWPKHP